jgi:hypothetical protein
MLMLGKRSGICAMEFDPSPASLKKRGELGCDLVLECGEWRGDRYLGLG